MKKKTQTQSLNSEKPQADTRDGRLSEFLDKVNEKYGKGFMGKASTHLIKHIPRIETGILALDIGIGGGVPAGRVTMFWGEKSSGKTTTSCKFIAAAQKYCANCLRPAADLVDKKTGELLGLTCDCTHGYRPFVVAYMDVENAMNSDWAKTLGVDLDRLIISRPEYAEQAIDISDAILRSGDVDALVLDSIAQLVPSQEAEASAEDWQQGLQARLVNKGCRRFGSAMNYCGRKFGRTPTIVLINQLRNKIGISWGSPNTKPGGMGQDFLTSVDVFMWRGKTETEEKTGKPLWTTHKFRVEKNKISGGAGWSGEYNLVVSDLPNKRAGEIMDEDWTFNMMASTEMFEKEKADGKILVVDGQRLNGKNQVIKHWLEHPDLYDEAKDRLLHKMVRGL